MAELFLSWSGEQSQKLAKAFKDWIETLPLQVTCFLSTDDIATGERSLEAIDRKLEAGSFGILFMTEENVRAPWMFFEAGALAKSIDSGRVACIAFGIKYSDLVSPMTKFQATFPTQEGIRKLVADVHSLVGGGSSRDALEKAFERAWPELHESWSAISDKFSAGTSATNEPEADPLQEVLNLCRRIEERLTSDAGRPTQLTSPVKRFGSLPRIFVLEVRDESVAHFIADKVQDAIEPAQAYARKNKLFGLQKLRDSLSNEVTSFLVTDSSALD